MTLHEIFSSNLTKLVKRRGITQTELAHKLNVSNATISNWMSGIKVPRMNKANQLADILGVPINILTDENGFEEYDHELAHGLIRISDLHTKKVPILGSVAAGEPITDEEFPGVYAETPIDCDFAVRIKGDSMEPTFLTGDIVFIKQYPELPYNGAVVVISIDDDASIKHVTLAPSGIVISSDNPAYPAQFISGEEHKLKVLGIPVGFTRMLKRTPLASKG